MKKVVSLLLAILLVISTLVACGGNSTPPENEHIHTPGAWVTVKEPSCAEGEQCQFCAICGELLQTLPIAATGRHKEVMDEAVAATCTSTGLTEGKHCATCGKIFVAQSETPKIAHAYDNAQDETCNTCGFVRDTSCKHTDVTILASKSATCIESGLTEGIVCNGCEEILQVQRVIDVLGHNEVVDAGYPATCTTAGLSDGKHCDRCNEVLIAQSYIKELGHDESDWVIEKEPTETEDGYKYKKCSICGVKTEEEIIPFVGDTGLEYSVNADGKTCTITGIGTFAGAVLDIPDYIRTYKVTAIGEKAFADCTQLAEINLPETVTTIGIRAFYGCTGITEITIPASVTSIGTQIFYKADNLHTVYYNSTYASSSNLFLNLSHIKKVVFGGKYVPSDALYNCANIETVEFATNITSVGSYAFYNTSLTSIVIPDSVKSIGHYAFSDCTALADVYYTGDVEGWLGISFNSYSANPMYNGANLYFNNELVTEIVVPDSVTSIGDYAFNGCTSLISIEIPDSVTSIGGYAFSDCISLTSIEIPDSVTSISSYAFINCISLTSIEIPDSVTSIYYGVFYDCISLTSIEIPDSVTSIYYGAFYNCTSLTSIEIPDSVTSIDQRAFYNCTSLTSIVIPDSVTSIGSDAFSFCTSLTIYCEATAKPSGWDSSWNYSNRPVVWGYTGE